MRIQSSISSVLLAVVSLAAPTATRAEIIFSIGIAPPPLPVYEQPVCPSEGYIWTPGYWAYSDDGGYFWVPGTWVLAPEPGYLWTPGYWGWGDGLYAFHRGYWGPRVGFYGGIDYGFGYGGVGYEGGYWRNGAFFYNRSVNNVMNVTNVYEKTVVVNDERRVSFNGGEGGIVTRPTSEEQAAESERHIAPTSLQSEHVQAASTNRELFESANHGRPTIAATPKPAQFSGQGVVQAREAGPSYRPPTERAPAAARTSGTPAGANEAAPAQANDTGPRTAGGNPIHPNDLPASQRTPSNTGNPKLDQKYQKTQDQLFAKQQQERQKLQQAQDREHQNLEQRKAPDAAKQQVEQKHQQQTQQLAQRHAQQQQRVQPKSEPKK